MEREKKEEKAKPTKYVYTTTKEREIREQTFVSRPTKATCFFLLYMI